MTEFLGKPFEYWIELKSIVDNNSNYNNENWLNKYLEQQGKLRAYESLIDKLTEVKNA